MSVEISEIKSHLHTNAAKIFEHATANMVPKKLNHGTMTDLHLLLGIMAFGNNDTTSPIPKKLREAGITYEALYELLRERQDLRSDPFVGEPKIGPALMATLQRADTIAKERLEHMSEHYRILTVHLAESLLLSCDMAVEKALRRMGVDKRTLIGLGEQRQSIVGRSRGQRSRT